MGSGDVLCVSYGDVVSFSSVDVLCVIFGDAVCVSSSDLSASVL